MNDVGELPKAPNSVVVTPHPTPQHPEVDDDRGKTLLVVVRPSTFPVLLTTATLCSILLRGCVTDLCPLEQHVSSEMNSNANVFSFYENQRRSFYFVSLIKLSNRFMVMPSRTFVPKSAVFAILRLGRMRTEPSSDDLRQ